ncbi:Calcium dependent cysteine protease [Paragonimus heterotremus]|uniref:Calcium dependent cysteine protease n=1 Tax=Paragonimus heterotremus TaxID=100268 RepID=A0A8J4TH71_9TREM|nr:Calcium dependent cysteine protease [Paragonimus heterotremus]
MNARSVARRHKKDSSVWDERFHLSKSLESSRKWFSRQVAEQLQRGGRFRDPFLKPDDSTIGPELCARGRRYDWLRPHEIVNDPQFVTDGISRFDVKQGEIELLPDTNQSLADRFEVIPFGQTLSTDGSQSSSSFTYCGMFWFRFWRFGDWVDVVIDDLLPTRNRQLVFMHSADRREFWSALLEKAYVKLIGTYDAMRGGTTSEAMEDFTGGLTEVMDLGEKAPKKLFSIMECAKARASLMATSIDAAENELEGRGPMGLITGHAYSITDVRRVTSRSGSVELVRLRNPWGNEEEWVGPWSDQSREWKNIPQDERKRIGLTFDNDGEFWMSFSDFVRYFSRIEFCHLGPESVVVGQSMIHATPTRRWEMTKEEGEWVRFATAGGCRNYSVQVIDPDETDDENMGTLIVGLMQTGRRETHQELHTIGYAIYRLPTRGNRDGLLGRAFFLANSTIARSPTFTNMREVVGRHKLEPGEYVIVPSTFAPNEEAKFILRIFSERACESNEIDDSTNIDKEPGVTPAKPTEDPSLTEKLRAAFYDVAGKSGTISYPELRDILNVAFTKDIAFDGFSLETTRSMVALMDTDLSGSLDFHQFKKLWMDLRVWKSIFKKFDRNQTSCLDAFELREILKTVGLSLSNCVYQAIICRYANQKGEILFDDYILLLVRLVTVIETYKAQERLLDGRAVFGLEEFTRSVIYI